MIRINSLKLITIKNTINNLVATTIIFFLTACGGGSSSGGGGLITTAPAAPAAPVVTLDNMVGLKTFAGHSAVFSTADNDTTLWQNKSNQTVATLAVNNNSDTVRLIINQQLTNNTILDLDVQFSQANYLYTVNGVNYLGGTLPNDNIMVLAYIANDAVLAGGVGSLEYVTGGLWLKAGDIQPKGQGGFIAAGFNTQSNEMPTTGSAVYNAMTDFLLFTSDTLYEGVAAGSFNVAFNTGVMTGDFPSAKLYDLSADAVTYMGTFGGPSFSGNITTGQSNFSGTAITNGANGLTGTFNGSFYGPNAEEIGGVYSMSNGYSAQSQVVNITGGFVGKK
jgi:hypothetical protein